MDGPLCWGPYWDIETFLWEPAMNPEGREEQWVSVRGREGDREAGPQRERMVTTVCGESGSPQRVLLVLIEPALESRTLSQWQRGKEKRERR